LANTLVRRILLQVNADDGDTEAKLDRINEKADELGKKHPELKVRIDTAAASAKVAVLREELKGLGTSADLAGKASGSSFASGFSAGPALMTAGIAAALAGAPAIAAAGGATAGVALGTALLIGTQQVQGPLYQQWHVMLDGLTGIMRTSALPLVRPLQTAFRQVGQWAQGLKPELVSMFASVGPAVAPMARGLEGLISGVLPGFITLMHAAQPAMQAFSHMLTQTGTGVGKLLGQLASGVGPASKFMTGLSSAVTGLLPLVGTLSNVLAGALAPVMQGLGGSLVPGLTKSLQNVLIPMSPLLKSLGTLIGSGMELANAVLPGLTGQVGGLTGAFNGLASAVGHVASGVSWLASHLGAVQDVLSQVLGHPNSGIPGFDGIDINGNNSGPGFGGIFSGLSNAFSGFGQLGQLNWAGIPDTGSAAWASGLSSLPTGGGGASSAQSTAAQALGSRIAAALGSGIRLTMPQAEAAASKLAQAVHKDLLAGAITQTEADSLISQIDKALQGRAQRIEAAGRKLGQQLGQSMIRELADSANGSAAKTAVGKLLTDIQTALSAGLISQAQAAAYTKQVDRQGLVLETLANQEARVNARISQARQFAAQTASSLAGGFGLQQFATTGVNGGPQTMGGIIGGLNQDVTQIRRFAGNIKRLQKMGLDKNYLNELIQMGPVQGGLLAAELADAGLGEIKAINKDEFEISKAAGSLGKVAADSLYDSGKGAAKGFLTGLEEQRRRIENVMRQAAHGMVEELRKELHLGKGGGTGKVVIELRGGDKEFRTWLKKIIRVTGGDVQVVGA